jgi:cell division transport system permease protein
MALAIDVALLIVIIVSVVFIVFQSVEATIMTRSREIEVMRLVGASNSTIRGPFYWEGVFQGLMAGLVAFVLSLLLYQVAVAQLPQPFFPVFGVLAFDAILGGVLGYMGADVALSRLVK